MKSFTEEIGRILDKFEKGNYSQRAKDALEKLRNQKVILFGGGGGANLMHLLINDPGFCKLDIIAYCDSYKTGTDELTGIPIISPDMLFSDYPEANVIISIASTRMHNEVEQTLKDRGFRGKIIPFAELTYRWYRDGVMTVDDLVPEVKKYGVLYDNLEDDESRRVLLSLICMRLLSEHPCYSDSDTYFDKKIIKLSDDEVFVDGGFYDGTTSMDFIRQAGGKYKHIYGFEADADNAALYKSDARDVTVVQKGLWEYDDVLTFKGGLAFGSSIDEHGNTKVPVTSIDSYFFDNTHIPTYIKMDIEGAEKRALLGACKTIKAHKPKLAISAYHRPEDLYELPKIIKSHNSEYKLFLRHHSRTATETILYAI